MAENTTTLLEKWQKQQQEHPDWTPSTEDLLYFIHGSGSDRDRVFTVAELFSSNKEIQLLTDNGTGDQHTITSADIVTAFKAGRIPVVVSGGGQSGVLTRLYFFPKKIYYNDNPTRETNRDCEFYCFGDDENGHKVLTWRRYYNIPAPYQGEKYSETVVDLTYPESMHSDELLLGSKWKIEKYVNGGAEALVVQRLNGSTWEDVAVFRADGTRVMFHQQELGLGSWDFVNGAQGSFVIQRTANGVTKQAMTTTWDGVVSFPNGVSGGMQVSGNLNVSGSISGTIAAKHVDLLSSTANPFDLNSVTGVGNYEPLYVFNEHSGSHGVSFNSSNSVSIGSRKFVVFVKINDLWYVQNDATT